MATRADCRDRERTNRNVRERVSENQMPERITLTALLEDIAKLQEAEEILMEIWQHLGPYTNVLQGRTLTRLQRYMDFDDSE